MLQLLDDKLCHRLWVRLRQKLVQLDLASVDEKDRAASSVNFMETSRHEFSNHVLLAHKVVVEKHVDLESSTPDNVFTESYGGAVDVEVRSCNEPSEYLPCDDQFVDIIQHLFSVDSLSEGIKKGLLLSGERFE